MLDLLHRLFGPHVPNPDFNHWRDGRFVSNCTRCGHEMSRLPGRPWVLSERQG